MINRKLLTWIWLGFWMLLTVISVWSQTTDAIFSTVDLPQVYSDDRIIDPAFFGQSWDRTITMGVDYPATFTGLKQARLDWCNAPNQWWKVINGSLISITGQWDCAKVGATKWFVITSPTPLPKFTTPCSRSTMPSASHVTGCANDRGNMGILEGHWPSGNFGEVFDACTIGTTNCPVGSNHLAITNQIIRQTAGYATGQRNTFINMSNGASSFATGTHDVAFVQDLFETDVTLAAPYTGAVILSSYLDFTSCISNCIAAYNYLDIAAGQGGEIHAIVGLWGQGWKIAYNFIDCCSEDILTGGAGGTITGVTENVYDVEVVHNYVTKPWEWMSVSGAGLVLKNDFELKTGTRWLIAYNVFENSSGNGGQRGQCITLTPRNSSSATGNYGGNYTVSIDNITIWKNVCRNALTGVELSGRSGSVGSGNGAAQPLRRVYMGSNLFYNISPGTAIIYSIVTQPWMWQYSGSGGQSWSANATCSPDGATATFDLILPATNGGSGWQQSTINPGDLVNVQGCIDATFNVGYKSQTFPNKGKYAITGTDPTGLTVVADYSSAHCTPGGTATGCTVDNTQGYPAQVTIEHNSVFGTYIGSGGGDGLAPSTNGPQGYNQFSTYRCNLHAPNPANYGGLLSQGGGNSEGTVSESDMWDTTTATYLQNIQPGKLNTKYTDWNNGVSTTPSTANYFPTTICPTGTANASCSGIGNMMNGVAYPDSQFGIDYHLFNYVSSSPYKAGGSLGCADGGPIGVDIAALDNGLAATTYTCTNCGTGPYPDGGNPGGGGGTGGGANPGGIPVTGDYSATSSVILDWVASSGATSYSVYRGTIGGPYEVINSGIGSTSFTDSHVEPHKQSCYVVTAFNANGESTPSNEACANVP